MEPEPRGAMAPEQLYHAVLINHKTCSLDAVRTLSSPGLDEIYSTLSGAAPGLVVLSTCNRVELYWYGEEVEGVVSMISEFFINKTGMDPLECAAILHGDDVVRHLFRVASGIESLMVGENEILAQVRQAAEEAARRGTLDPYLRLLFHRAVVAGKRARRETRISAGAVSIPLVAARLASEEMGGLEGRTVVIVGAGEAAAIMAEAVAKQKPGRLIVVNRTPGKAKRLAEMLDAEWGGLDMLPKLLGEADVILVAVSGPVLSRDMLDLYARQGLLVIDISMPPAVEGSSRVSTRWIDDLKPIAEKNRRLREAEIPRVERIVEEEVQLFRRLVRRRAADEVLARIMERAESIRKRELERALQALSSRGAAPDGASFIVEAMSRSIVRKVLQPVFSAAREAAERGDFARLKLMLKILGGEQP